MKIIDFYPMMLAILLFTCSDREKSEFVYYDDGKTKSEMRPINDSITVYYGYYPNGKLRDSLTITSDYLTGPGKNYFEDGKLFRDCIWKDGLLNGPCTTYYESGNLMNILTYNDSIPIGDAIEYYDLPGNRVKYTLNYSKVDGKKWVNWQLKYDTTGNIIKSTTVVENIIAPKTIKIGDSLKIEFHLQYPQYPKTKVYYGDYDDDFNLIDTSSIKSSYGSKNAVTIYVRPRKIGKDTVRGILENYKVLDSLKTGLTKTEGKMIYWSHKYDVVK